MVMYRDYVSDFPRRCSRLLRELRSTTQGMGLEVTHLLSITTVGLIVPHERLKEGSRTPHPSGDLHRYKAAVSEYNRLRKKAFLSSPIWPDGGAATWRKGKVDDVETQAPGFVQTFENAKPVLPDDKAGTVVGIMRNALAHGNIVTMPKGSQINDIMFLSEHKKRFPVFRFVAVEQEDLCRFMMNYIEFLSRLDLGRGLLVGGAPEAT